MTTDANGGSAGFFDQYDRFYSTSQTSPHPHRLNGRHEAVIARNAHLLVGKRVLDIGSHDGRWSFAALKAGAAHVLGVEPRAELVANAHETFACYGMEPTSYEFVCDGVFEFLSQKATFDVVLCLGFYYHTLRHVELFDLIERTGAGFVVIDTEVTPPKDQAPIPPPDDPRIVHGNPYIIQLLRDPVSEQQMAWEDPTTREGHTIVGRCSPAAIGFIARHFGFTTDSYDWPAFFASHPEAAVAMHDYREGWRQTFFCSR